jgi:hypothetical protein
MNLFDVFSSKHNVCRAIGQDNFVMGSLVPVESGLNSVHLIQVARGFDFAHADPAIGRKELQV